MDVITGGKLGSVVYLGVLVAAGVWAVNLFSYQNRQNKAAELVRQATEEDVVSGNQARVQLGGFQQPSRIPGPSSMDAVERGDNNRAGPVPNSAATSRHARTTRGRRY